MRVGGSNGSTMRVCWVSPTSADVSPTPLSPAQMAQRQRLGGFRRQKRVEHVSSEKALTGGIFHNWNEPPFFCTHISLFTSNYLGLSRRQKRRRFVGVVGETSP